MNENDNEHVTGIGDHVRYSDNTEKGNGAKQICSPSLLTEWVERFANAVYALAYSRIGDYHHAQDIAQETFLKAYLNEHDLHDKTKAGSWLYTIAIRTTADWVKANRIGTVPLSETGELDPGRSIEETIISRERRDAVWHSLESLDEASRTVLVLFHMNDWSLQEIGDFLGIGVKAADSRLRRAREKLREHWIETVERELRTRKPAKALHRSLLAALPEGRCDRLLVKEGLRLTGDTDETFATTAKCYRVPLLIDLTAKTDSTNIRLKFANGGIVFNWEHDPDALKWNDPEDGAGETIRGSGRLAANEWAHIQWYMDEKLSVVLVGGQIVHAVRGSYADLSGPIGVGPAWSSVVTLRTFRVREHPDVGSIPALRDIVRVNGGERINLRMLTRWSPDRFGALRQSFEAGRPHLMVTLESVSSPALIKERAQADDAPDLIPVRPQDIVPMLEKGLIMDLTPFAEREPDVMADLFVGVRHNCVFGGKLAIVPFEPRVPGFLYKKDRFDEQGIPYPAPGWTWEQFVDSAIRLTKRDKDGNALQYGVVVQKDWMFVESVILSSGGSLLSPDGSRAVGYLDSDASVRAVQRFVDLFLVHKVAPVHHDPILQPYNFYNEKIGMFGEGSWMAQEGFIKPDNRIGTVGMPVIPEGGRSSAILVGGYAISSRSKHPELAWELMKRLVRPDADSARQWARFNVAWSNAMAERSGQAETPYFGPFLSELPYAGIRAQTVSPHLLRTSLNNDVIRELITTGADVGETLERLARIVDSELEQMHSCDR